MNLKRRLEKLEKKNESKSGGEIYQDVVGAEGNVWTLLYGPNSVIMIPSGRQAINKEDSGCII